MAKYKGVTQNTDGSWTYRIKLKLPNGKVVDTRIKKDESGLPFLTARAAHEAKAEHEARLKAKPEAKESEKEIVTLEDVYKNYLATEAKEKAPATLRKQDSMWRNHISPIFAKRDINSIDIIELKDFLVNLYKTKSYKYTEGFLKFFYLLFGHADRMEKIDPDRYLRMFVTKKLRLDMPKISQTDREKEGRVVTFDNEELAIIKNAFESEDGNLKLAFYLGLYAGLRISECFGLRWQNIDWNTKTMKIDRQMQYIDGEFHLCAVKTLAGDRSVIIPEELYAELEFQDSFQTQQKKALGNGYRNTERVYDEVDKCWIVGGDFVNRKRNGELLTVNSMKYWSKKITPLLHAHAERKARAKKGIHLDEIVPVKYKDFKYHYLRHTYASNCAAQNISMYKLMDMMGHQKIDTTKRYYINTENDTLNERTRKLLNEMYAFDK